MLMNKFFTFFSSHDHMLVCDTCHFSKHKKLPYTTIHSRATLMRCYIWGPLSVISIHCHRCVLTILDDYYRFVCYDRKSI